MRAVASHELAQSNGVELQGLPATGPTQAFEVALVTADVEAAFAQAVSEGATPVKEPALKPWGQLVGYVRDINGFMVEICSPRN